MEKSEALIIVAHPDDETIWMGGTIIRNKDWNWTILSLTRENDSDRRPKFERVCQIYNAKAIISDLDDTILEPLSLMDIIDKIKTSLLQKKYSFIFTHGKNGEYGHIRHIEVHNAVEQMVQNADLIAKEVFFFNYKKGENVPYPELKVPEPIISSDFVLDLDEQELELKKKIIREIYGYPNEKGFELMSCNKRESFNARRTDAENAEPSGGSK
jgi:LmbE family N-acetylglucosaminyl deacetylase